MLEMDSGHHQIPQILACGIGGIFSTCSSHNPQACVIKFVVDKVSVIRRKKINRYLLHANKRTPICAGYADVAFRLLLRGRERKRRWTSALGRRRTPRPAAAESPRARARTEDRGPGRADRYCRTTTIIFTAPIYLWFSVIARGGGPRTD